MHIALIRFKEKQLLLLFATIIGFIGGSTNFLPSFGVKIYPIGNFFLPIYALMATYAITKNQLWTAKLAIKKSLVYYLTIGCISTFFLLTVYITEKILQNILGYDSILVSIIVAFIIGILFIPLRNKIQTSINLIFFHGDPENLIEQNEKLRSEILLTQKYKSIVAMVNGIAHEVRNPLTSLYSFTENLPDKINDPDFLKTFANVVPSESQRIIDLLEQLMDYSQIKPVQITTLNLTQLLSELTTFIKVDVTNQKIQLRENYPPDFPPIESDANLLKQVFFNLILNAIDAMPDGGQLNITTTLLNEDKISINFQDEGSGIPPKVLEKIYQPFQTTKTHGKGMGLAITRNIIEILGGQINIKTSPKGTHFKITLPIKNDIEYPPSLTESDSFSGLIYHPYKFRDTLEELR